MHDCAVITGGGKGIGLAIARALSAAGHRVVICGRDIAVLEAVAAELAKAHVNAVLPLHCDVTVEADVEALFERLDGAKLHPAVLVNNAGTGSFKPLVETTAAEWDAVSAVNVRGAFLCAREAMKRMQARGGGRIVNIGSVVSFKGYPNQGAYSASKHALLGLTKVLAVEGAAHGIVVQAVCPGGVDTGMVADARPDLDRAGLIRPDDVAEAVLFCLGQQGQAITDIVTLRRRDAMPFA